jgi:hypothetical protein
MDSLSQVDSEVVTAAEAAMQGALHHSVFNHSMRVLRLARHLSPHQTVPDHERWDWPPQRIRPVWETIALHTSPGIAERFGPLAHLVRAAVIVDLGRTELPVASTTELESRLARLAPLDIDRVLPELVVAQTLQPGRATKAPPFSCPGELVSEHRSGNQVSTNQRSGTTRR